MTEERPFDLLVPSPMTRRRGSRSSGRSTRRFASARSGVGGDPDEMSNRGSDQQTGTRSGRLRLFAIIGVAVTVVLLVAVLVVVRVAAGSKDTPSMAFTDVTGPLEGTAGVDHGVWRVRGGSFGVTDGGVAVQPRTPATPAVAAFEPRGTPTVITSNMRDIKSSSGLLFRYQDAQNYWSLVAAPQYGTWNVNKTAGGKTEFVSNTGLGFTRSASILEVRLADSSISVYVNGVLSQQVVSSSLQDARGVGILASAADQGETYWTSYSVQTQ
jgi:hypothetical protein